MPLQDIPVPFGEWLPDLGENNNPGLVEVKNAIPDVNGYRHVSGRDPLTVTETGVGFSCNTFRFGDVAVTVAEETNRLFSIINGSIVDTEAISSTGPIPTAGIYRFAKFDDNIYCFRPYALTGTIGGVYKVSTAGVFSTVAEAPGGVGAAQIGRLLMFARANAYTNSSTFLDPKFSFYWSAFNNPDDFTISQTTQSGAATVNDTSLGEVTGIVGGRSPMIFQQFGITRIGYAGPPRVWVQNEISKEIGCVAPMSLVTVDDITYFISHVGVCATNGTSVDRIGAGRVNDWLLEQADDADLPMIQAAHVEADKAIYWAFRSTSSPYSETVFDKILGYSYVTNRFFNLDVGDGVRAIGSYGVSRNGTRVSRDSQRLLFWNDSSPGELTLLNRPTSPGTSNALAAELTTGYTTLTPGKRTSVNNVEPVYDGSGAKVAINTRATLAGAASAGTPVAVNSLGIADVRADGRLAAVSVTFDAGAEWSELKGAVVAADTSGAR